MYLSSTAIFHLQGTSNSPHLGRTLSTKVALGRGRPWGKHYRKREQGSHPGKMKGKRRVFWGNFERNESKNLGGGSCFWMATPQFFEHQTLKMLPPFSFLGSPLESQDTTELPVLHLPAGWFGTQEIPLSWQLGIQIGGIGWPEGTPKQQLLSFSGIPGIQSTGPQTTNLPFADELRAVQKKKHLVSQLVLV